MKKLNKNEMESIIAVIGNEVSNGFTSPKYGLLGIKAMEPVPARDQQNSDGTVTHINAWVRVDFEDEAGAPAGSASLRSVLISPDITWKPEWDNQEKRINALAEAKLTFTHMESKTSKSGNPYKVCHFAPISL